MKYTHVKTLIRKELTLEWRQKYAIGGVVLYLVSMVFVAYLSFEGIIPLQTWNALFWLIMLFAAMNTILKAFVQEHGDRYLYYYSLLNPTDFIVAKTIYNALLMLLMGGLGLVIFIAFMGNPIQSMGLFVVNILLGMTGLASVLTLISAIASGAKNNFTLMAVLGFPLVLPLLLMLIRVSSAAMGGSAFVPLAADILIIAMIILIANLLSFLLFPYIWRL